MIEENLTANQPTLSLSPGVRVRGDGSAAAHGCGPHRKLLIPPACPRPHPGLPETRSPASQVEVTFLVIVPIFQIPDH